LSGVSIFQELQGRVLGECVVFLVDSLLCYLKAYCVVGCLFFDTVSFCYLNTTTCSCAACLKKEVWLVINVSTEFRTLVPVC
jgi:hypothetical protein